MFKHKQFVVVVALVAFWGHALYAMVYDNRFFPLIKPPFITVDKRRNYADVNVFITTAHSAFGENDQTIGIPEVFGVFDENQLAQAIAKTGKPNPLIAAFPTDIDILLMELPWHIRGKIQAQGMSFAMRKTIGFDWLSIGFSWLFMRVDSSQFFTPNFNEQKIDSLSTIAELEDLRISMEKEIGITCSHAHQTGMGDLDVYIRFGNIWDYVLKCRSIQAALSIGALVPTGELREINVPASVPFGGDGHPGFYFAGELELELKEDLRAGLLLRAQKRSAKESIQRMPACKEPSIFGAIIGCANVRPGGTIIFAPYAMLENIRDGFGALAQFTLTQHFEDVWTDLSCPIHNTPANTESIKKHSNWRESYVTLYAFYDFGKMKPKRNFEPIFTVEWDIPVGVCDAHGSAKTQKVALGFEFNF